MELWIRKVWIRQPACTSSISALIRQTGVAEYEGLFWTPIVQQGCHLYKAVEKVDKFPAAVVVVGFKERAQRSESDKNSPRQRCLCVANRTLGTLWRGGSEVR